ncbi:MAG: stage V sporulation protein AD [Firmicutes bacterium]|nr:stage V sporulation protein AD [Bacillota bacterium]
MTKRQTITFKNPAYIAGSYSIAGKKEARGPLGKTFTQIMEDEYFGEKTHEGAERKMFETAIAGAIETSPLDKDEIEIMFSGDLLNQITSSTFAARTFDTMFIGIYGACSTMALTLAMAACMIDAGHIQNAVASAGSHFATAERQYRTPLELGNIRPPTAQWTVTGVGATVLTATPDPDMPRITSVTFGRVCDWGISDPNNMGAAMAPSAAQTFVAHFRDTKTTPADYCHIFTGDLGKLGENILRDLLADENYPVDANYTDCGRLVYDTTQTQYQGASGCGCSAICLNGFILDKLRSGEYKKILLLGTGALLSTTSSFQGETIPGISHAVVIESN